MVNELVSGDGLWIFELRTVLVRLCLDHDYAALIVHHVQRLAAQAVRAESAVDFKGAKVEAFLAGRSILQSRSPCVRADHPHHTHNRRFRPRLESPWSLVLKIPFHLHGVQAVMQP